MTVRELRERLIGFDDEIEIVAAPEIRMELVGKDKDIVVPHPTKHYELRDVHVVGDVDQKNLNVTKRYIVIAFLDPGIIGKTSRTDVRKESVVGDRELLRTNRSGGKR